jgi:RNA polymerase sigma-70 factor (ECF subfamily)
MSVRVIESSRESDSELLIAIASGNRRAENIEEIIDDTFTVAWRNANKFRSASLVSTRIFGIAYRRAPKAILGQKKHAGQRLDELQEGTIDPMLAAEVQDWVTLGLNCLPDEQRLALELASRMGYSLTEIAEITGTPIGIVKVRMFHARQKLRQYLPTLGGELAERMPNRYQAAISGLYWHPRQ